MIVTILKKRWRLRWVRLRKCKGDCDSPTTRNKEMRIRVGMSQRKELEYVLHECLHAADWTKDEVWVQDVAGDLAQVLWRLGWRKTDA